MKKTLCLILCALMLAPTFTACSNGSDSTNDSTNPGSTSENTPPSEDDASDDDGEVTRANTPDNLPDDLNFDGMTINIYHFGSEDTLNYDTVGEMSGDVVLDAVYNRNVSVEDRLNVKLNWIAGDADWDGFPSQVLTVLEAASGDYDLIVEESSRLFQQSLSGYYYDLMNISDYIDLDQPWWYTDLMEESSLDNSKRYYLNGDAFLTCMLGASAVYFNKQMYTDYFGDVQQLYDQVLDGTWTYDALADYSTQVYTDTNGDGQVDDGDIYGFRYEQWGIPNYTSMSNGLTYITRDEEGFPVLDILTEDSIQWGQTLYRLLYSDNIAVEGDKLKTFTNQTSLFLLGMFKTAPQLRNVSFDYGIVPYPKLNETLDYVSGAETANGNGGAIPVSIAEDKIQPVCAVLEALCAESYRKVVPAWYDTALKVKYSDGPVDAQMIDIIYEHINCPFIMVADKLLGTGSIFTNAIYGSGNDGAFVSYYESKSKSLEKSLEKAIEDYKEILH